VPNILDSGKRIKIGVRGPSLMRMEMCTAESGRMESLSRAKSPGMVDPGMAVQRMHGAENRLVFLFMKTFVIQMPHNI
jgi:hypothetical protein